ncbi:hypothetical protein CFC21_081572 [Triticum aestivum]|uniref:Uncharacterized protein n=2 Tax=Triticum aestivum TaxID=4565 RepID=A0A9R1I3L2_WHEAT|nr:hypothetical protein CFC21_081571 [Triticum aestivum]KAF7076977.1 hypothetical protein CFC21_081572 [Triticum aestivum]
MDGIATFHFFETWSTFSRDGDRAVMKLPYLDRTQLCRVTHPLFIDTLSLFCLKINLSQPWGQWLTSAVSAHLWQCMCLARRLPPNSIMRLVFAANIRRAMTPPLPDGYFGNVVINVSVADEACGIASGNLAYIAHRIKDTLGRVDDELLGKAVGLRAESNRGGYAHLIDSAHGDGSVHIVMCIDATILKEFKRLLYAKFESMVYSKF